MAAQAARQERELDEAYDGLQVDLRKVPCKNWHKVGPEPSEYMLYARVALHAYAGMH